MIYDILKLLQNTTKSHIPCMSMVYVNNVIIRTIFRSLLNCVSSTLIPTRYLAKITEWHASDVITDRKSRFQARHVPITDEQDIPAVLEQLLEKYKNISRSSHPHIIAWRTGQPTYVPVSTRHIKSKRRKGSPENKELRNEIKYDNISQGFKDNGEKGAGSKLLQQVLVHHNLINILVIVTRWYGGSPLGPLRFRHIINASLDSLRKSNTI